MNFLIMRYQYIFFAFIALVVLGCGNQAETKLENPNIIYILADDMGYGDVGVYNANSKIKTPELDKLANDGMRFTDAHTSSSVCTPTRYGVMTGRYNWRSKLKKGVLSGKSPALIPENRTTVASMLKERGYNTAFIGKWHLGWNWNKDSLGVIDFSKRVEHTPNDLGFDYAYGHCGSLDMPPYVYVENGIATKIPIDTIEQTKGYGFWRKGLIAPDFVHEDVTPNFFRRGIEYIKENANKDKPFFLYLPLPSPHTPILPTEEWQGKSGVNPYGDFVMMIDDYIGQLNNAVKAAGIEENTMIIFTTDNGCSPAADIGELQRKGHTPNGIYRGHKADIFEGGHRVPFIVKWPQKIEKGSVSNTTICTTDFAATCAAITGYTLKDNEAEDSYNMLPLFNKEGSHKTFREATVHHSINGSFAIRKGDWKLIMCPGSGGWSFPRPNRDENVLDTSPKIQLYNLKTDPTESDNLQAENIEKVDELKTLLTKYIKDGRSTLGLSQENDGERKWKQLWWVDTI